MPSERIQRQIDQLLDDAEQAVRESDWILVRSRTEQVLAFDPDNADALAFQAAAERASTASKAASREIVPQPQLSTATSADSPASYANGRYAVRKFLGEGGKKRVYLAHDGRLDRDVAFALIKTEGLDQTARERISREAQAMGRLGAHPHIVTVFDLGEEAGQPYMVDA